MGGYRIHTENIKVNTAEQVRGIKGTMDVIGLNLDGIDKLGTVEAGESIAPEVTKLATAWKEVLPKMGKEFELLADSVKKSAEMIEKVEVVGSRGFDQFAR